MLKHKKSQRLMTVPCVCVGKKLGEKKSRRKGKKFKESISGASFKDRTMLKDRRGIQQLQILEH